MPSRKYHASGKQVLFNGQHYADALNSDEALRVAHAMNTIDPHQQKMCMTCKKIDGHEPGCADEGTDPRPVVIKRSHAKRLADAEEILAELAGVFHGYAKLHAAKGTPEGDEKAKRNAIFAHLINDFLAQDSCSHEHQVPFDKANGITSLICLGCGQTRMEFFTPNPHPSKEHAEATASL